MWTTDVCKFDIESVQYETRNPSPLTEHFINGYDTVSNYISRFNTLKLDLRQHATADKHCTA